MIDLKLKDVYKLASKLYWELDAKGQIFPPSTVCSSNDECWLFIRERHKILRPRIEQLLAHMVLDAEQPKMTIEEQFFVKEKLSFASFLANCIDPNCDEMDEPAPYSEDVMITIKGASTEHFLMWLADFVCFCLGESDLLCKAQEVAIKSRELNLTNTRWLIMREDPFT